MEKKEVKGDKRKKGEGGIPVHLLLMMEEGEKPKKEGKGKGGKSFVLTCTKEKN